MRWLELNNPVRFMIQQAVPFNQDLSFWISAMKYSVVFHRQEALANIQDAIVDYLAAIKEMNRGQETHKIDGGLMTQCAGINHLVAVRALEKAGFKWHGKVNRV